MRPFFRAGVVGAAAVVVTAIAWREGSAKEPGVTGTSVEYHDGATVCEGYVAKETGRAGKRPGVLVVHDWMGQGDFAKKKADALAALGYVGFSADVYGKDVRPKNPQEAGVAAGKWKGDRAAFRTRMRAALEALLKDPDVDPARVAVMGFCFGGTAALELGRSGAPIAGIVSFHGGLDSPTPADGANIKAKVLALAGADDGNVPPKQVEAFVEEMKSGKVDWQLVEYGGAMHAFTNPQANDPEHFVKYDAKADHRSWEAMKTFFAEIFGAPAR